MDDLKAAVENAKGTLEEMANRASVDMAIWDRHANAVLDLCARVVALRARIAELEAGLEPFADYMRGSRIHNDAVITKDSLLAGKKLTLGNCRLALALLERKPT